MEGLQRRDTYHVVWQTVPGGGSSNWEGPATDGRQFNGRINYYVILRASYMVIVGRQEHNNRINTVNCSKTPAAISLLLIFSLLFLLY